MLRRLAIGLFILLSTLSCMAQNAVPVGKGSYASTPPPATGDKLRAFESKELFLVKETDQPIPTNKWWTQLVVSRFARSLWSYPLRVDTSEKGLDIFFPIRWQSDGRDPLCDFPLNAGGKDFTPRDARAKDWSDWTCSFRMAQSPDKYFDVTLGEGMPCLWIEYHGVQPELTLPGGSDPKFFSLTGQPAALPATADCVGVQYKERQYGLFAPDNTRFTLENNKLRLQFTGKAQFMVICPLPRMEDMAYVHRYAYAIPRNTKMAWQYDPVKARVTTTWNITTEALKGTERQVIQGWIPHHYRNTIHDLAFNNLTFLSPRGKLRCTVGNSFVISYPYTGIVPNLPQPKPRGGTHDYSPTRMHSYLAQIAAIPNFASDTYWGGKDILRFGQSALMAQQSNDPTYKSFVDGLYSAMADWYTYKPGKKDHYFTYYPHWKALVGINPSYGSEEFNDHHFHYGYFTFASALLAMQVPSFVPDYGEMAILVAKDYANWDRNDRRFPFLRTFDIWAGHSWAGGTSSPGGENQESSSEAVQSWAGLIYLGEALGDGGMRDAGIMGYAMETQATMEYWFDQGGDVFPPEWKHPVTGMVWSGGKVFGTYFTGDPAWIYGIQWLPSSPMLSYLVHDPAFARKSYENMCRDYEMNERAEAAKTLKAGEKPHIAQKASIHSFGSALGSVMLGYVLMYDPNWAAEQLDILWNTPGDTIAHDANEMTIMYYQAHAMRGLGLVDWNCHGSSPTSIVYRNPTSQQRTYIVWNPTAKPQMVRFYDTQPASQKDNKKDTKKVNNQHLIGQLVAAPRALTNASHLSPVTGQ